MFKAQRRKSCKNFYTDMKKGINNEIEIYQNFDFHFCIQENTCLCSECVSMYGERLTLCVHT